jgi:hypothetical protein
MAIDFHRKGKRLYGAFIPLSTGLAYVAFRKPDGFFRDAKPGEPLTLSQALEQGRAAWAIDESTILECRARGVKFVGVFIKKLNWIFLTDIANYHDPTRYYQRNYSARGGADQRYLPCKFFTEKHGSLKI